MLPRPWRCSATSVLCHRLRVLNEAKAEADFGYSGTFKDEEYNDPAPRWREALVRALGLLGAHRHTSLLVRVLNDERSVVERDGQLPRPWLNWATNRLWRR